MNLRETIEKNIDVIKQLRNNLNRNAELSFQEYKTQEIIMDFFDKLGISSRKVAGTGVAATLNYSEFCIAVRADMDALPVNGVSHACGHDFHMAIVAGVALILKELGYEKCVKFVFQPGEETEGGAVPMIQEGVLENPKVNSMIGFHVWPNVRIGTIEVAAGPSMASDDDFTFTFSGRGGHAAMPHLCRNPLYPAIDFIQTINEKSRSEINPLDSHVITFASLQSGDTCNVIPDQCVVKGTVRTFNNSTRSIIKDTFLNTADLCAEKYGCSVEIKYDMQFPPLISDTALTNSFIDTTNKLIGANNVLPLEKTFAAEDFAYFAEQVPSVHFRLGIEGEGKGTYPLHNVSFDASEDAIFHGIHIITNFILSNTSF